MDMNVNLMRGKPFAHRQLFEMRPQEIDGEHRNVRQPKETYTMQDLWEYYNLLYLGRGESFAGATTTRVQRESRKRKLLQQMAPMTQEVYDLFVSLVKKRGLEVVLMAIEAHVESETSHLADPLAVERSMYNAQAAFNRLQHRSRMAT